MGLDIIPGGIWFYRTVEWYSVRASVLDLTDVNYPPDWRSSL